MVDTQKIGDVLVDILRVLERIERKLDNQDERFKQLKTPVATINGLETSRGPSINEDTRPLENSHIPAAEGKELSASEISLSSAQNGPNQGAFIETNIPVHPVGQPLATSRIPYSCWSFGQQDQEADEGLQEILQKHFGDYWKIPQDNRLPLKIIQNFNKNRGDYGESQVATPRVSIFDFEKRLALFSRFDTVLRSHKGNDFLVIDYDPANNTRLYRLGEKAVGDELMVLPEGPEGAPWSRLM